MASYTMELREMIEVYSGLDPDSSKVSDIIEAGRPSLFDFDYPIYDLNYKQDFETHFIRNFYMTEIGFETEGLFKFNLETWLFINMPYYNKLFESELLDYDPLTNVNQTDARTLTRDDTRNDSRSSNLSSETKGNATNTGSENTSNNGTKTENNFDRHLDSDTPDDRLSITPNSDGSGVIEYASKISEDTQNNSETVSNTGTASTNSTATSDATTTGTQTDTLSSAEHHSETDTKTLTGKTGVMTYPEMIQKYRDVLLRIEKQIFDEMRGKLFMLVY